MTLLTLLAAALAQPAAAPPAPPAPPPSAAPAPVAAPVIDARTTDLLALANGGGDPAAIFHPDFLAKVSEAQLRPVFAQIAGAAGRALRIGTVTRVGPTGATVTIIHERGIASYRLAVAAAPPHRIVGLLSQGVSAPEATLPAVVGALRALPGRTAFALADVSARPATLLGHNADIAMPVGSAFKLVILAELIRATNAGERRWDDLVTLDGRDLPGGAYTQSPKGTQVSLRALAEKMISVSDNSATDLLLFALGRDQVERMQRTVGIADPARNQPFLSTLEAFKLKGIARLRDPWLAGDARARREMLPAVEAAPLGELGGLFADGKPVAIDAIEWFMSPADLIRTMDWLRRNTETGAGAEARRILAINPGVGPAVAGRYSYVGYKGGSEPGVITMTLLLQNKAGGWRVMTGSWADPAKAVDDMRFAGLISRAAELAATP